jgi:unsaturated rhamnogalacturonyl hydrolase
MFRIKGYPAALVLFSFAVLLSASICAQTPADSLNPPPTPPQTTAPAAEPLNPALPTVFIVGDSTARNQADLGWGDHFAHYFDTTRINVANRAIAGRSSRSYIREGAWDRILAEMKPGDYVLLQMGHNDSGDLGGPKARGSLHGLGDETQDVSLPNGSVETVHTYGWYMRKYFGDTRAKHATPLLLSLTIRNIWTPGTDGQQHIERDMGYDTDLRQLAAQENVPYIDMATVEADRLEAIGPTKTALLFPKDHTHTNSDGAEQNALCVTLALRQANSPLATFLLPAKLTSHLNENSASPVWTAESTANSYGITPQEQIGIDRDISRHFGDAPTDPGPKADLSGLLRPADVRAAMRKVANWQLDRSQPYFDRIWTWSVLYAGFMATSPALHDPRYRDAMQSMADKFQWEERSPHPNADDQSLAQSYLELYLSKPESEELAPTKTALDALIAGAGAPIPPNQAQIPWWWCDALFMAPPVWSRIYAATHDRKYLDYLNQHWWQTSGLLYDTQRHLYYRDITYLHKTDARGNPIFWSRGEGWVMGGIARALDFMPQHDPDRARYETQLRQMAAAIAALQDPIDGLWHSDLLDPKDFPQPEVSGSALITFALAWGVNHNILDRAKYMPVITKAWRGLVGQIYADGRLGNIQQTGAEPAHYLPSSSYTYGVGAFLLAGAQVAELHAQVDHHHATERAGR